MSDGRQSIRLALFVVPREYAMGTMEARHAHGRQQHGEKYDPSDLDAAHASIKDAFTSGLRVKIDGPHGVRTGVVSTTTGWRPAFLLVHRSSDHGSSDVLGPDDLVIATWSGRRYVDGTPIGRALAR